MPRTIEEYRQQVAEDAGPHPDEVVRLQQALDAAEEEVARLQVVRDEGEREIRRLIGLLVRIHDIAKNGLEGGDDYEAMREIEMLSGND
jgi:hypothetical protein